MKCIFFSGKTCEAHPPLTRLAYEPSEEEISKLCTSKEFQHCPRFQAFIDYLKAISKPSP